MATVTKFASSNTVVTTGWTSPTNAYADDAAYTTCAPAKNGSVRSDFGFAAFTTSDIPDGSTINSVTIEIQYKSSTTGSTGSVVGLQGNNGGSLQGSETTYAMNTADQIVTKQYTSGFALADLRVAGTVKARVRGARGNSNTAITWSVDYVKVTVNYSPAPITFAGSVSGSASLSGDVDVARRFAGSVSGASSLGGDADVARRFAGGVSGASGLDGALTVTAGGGEVLFAGSVAGASALSGDADVTRRFSGGLSGSSSLAGNVRAARAFSGSVSGVGSVTGDVDVARRFAGSVSGTSALSGGIRIARPFAGSVGAASSLAGNATVARSFSGAVTSGSDVNGNIEVARRFAGSVWTESSLYGALSVSGSSVVPFSGSVLCSSALTGSLEVVRTFSGTCAMTSVLAGRCFATGGQVAELPPQRARAFVGSFGRYEVVWERGRRVVKRYSQ